MRNAALFVGALVVTGLAVDASANFFHVTARNLTGNHMVWMFDETGNYTSNYEQVAGAQGSAWGYRDGACDGQYVYFGWETGLARHNLDGSGGTQIFNFAAPGGVGTWRALAYDPTGDGGNGSLWTANFASDLIEVDLNGNLLNQYSGTWSLYGLAYDYATGNLYGHSGGGEVIIIDITTNPGNVTPGWLSGFPNLAAQGGLSEYLDGSGRLAAISQGTPDELGVYDSTGAMVGGPWNVEATAGNGVLGVAVIPGPAGLALLGLAFASRRRRR